MSSYRFCRTDDVALLVEAYNRCYRVHFGGLPELTVADFKAEIRRINLWCSSCMVAVADREPIAVLLAGKRDDANLIHRIGVHPDHQRRGHGRHLLDSLGAKLAILGPPRMVAEVPADWTAARGFLEACGYARERDYVDFERSARSPTTAGGAEEMLVPVTVDELVQAGALDPAAPRCWERAHRTLLNLRAELPGLAVATDRVEAFLLYRDTDPLEIVALGAAGAAGLDTLPGLLIDRAAGSAARGARMRRVATEEVPFEVLERCGFRPAGRWIGYAAQARPG